MPPIASWGIDDKPQKGPWFPARYSGGEKSCCDEPIEEAEEIRADGSGGWEGRCCDNDGNEEIPDVVWPKRKRQVRCPVCFMTAEPGACYCPKEKE